MLIEKRLRTRAFAISLKDEFCTQLLAYLQIRLSLLHKVLDDIQDLIGISCADEGEFGVQELDGVEGAGIVGDDDGTVVAVGADCEEEAAACDGDGVGVPVEEHGGVLVESPDTTIKPSNSLQLSKIMTDA